MLLRIVAIIAAVVVVLLVIGWVGFRIPAPSYPLVAAARAPKRVPLPQNLPAPVQRYIQTIFGDSMPKVESGIVVGRGWFTVNGITMPGRCRFYYDAHHGHYHDIQTTWFTLPILQIHERFLDGHAILDLSILGRVENDPLTDRSANQGFWSEMLAWMPAIVFADPRVGWEAIDVNTARMIVPDADPEEHFTVRFDPDTGLLTELTTLRYQGNERKRWTNHMLEWRAIDGAPVGIRASTQWEDASPWAVWEIEQVIPNVDVSARMAKFGA